MALNLAPFLRRAVFIREAIGKRKGRPEERLSLPSHR